MTTPQAALRQVTGAPRWLGDALRRQRRALRATARAPGMRALRTRFGGALLGEELIATLSDRLATTLRWWTAAAPTVPAAAASRSAAAGPVGGVAAAARASVNGALTASISRQRVRGTQVSDGAQVTAFPRTTPDVGLANASHADRAHGSELAAPPPRAGEPSRSSPLDSALRRYWQAAERIDAANASTRQAASVVPAALRPSADERPMPASDLAAATADRPDVPAPSPRAADHRWWSGRIEAIHARLDTAVATPPPTPRADEAIADETVFADALAEVLRQQARSHGVDVV